mmetsp:Transcript_512/g.527  ORF Transcript_512/g.527 Transcript_512/m.527 type:complete len:301 (+) Transcript_512:514-1416(+)|eukprot:CAMPEP_0170481754 /NCGR_PEP_ID=MMETSP0208-20121228/2073_1 /TAXON_ID=197538 /ORGANISM="Strombidium inclinatum, Strain S3" /LENGTH=300 /DNA_ID=CAMNT_0010754513 /DNA_START=470 /DNA_END=1369 /DNA_ORIENTATION=+
MINLPVVRQILLREQVDICHGHMGTSMISLSTNLVAKLVGVRTVYTEHSLFQFNDAAGIHLNKLVKWFMCELDAAIGVSHICKDTMVLRAKIKPQDCFVIPNAVDSNKFYPLSWEDECKKDLDTITIVYVSRLEYRKGADFLVDIIPAMLEKYPTQLKFLIGGGGSKMAVIKNMVEKRELTDKVTLLGAILPNNVRNTLVQGDIFLNTSLTESFCIANLEAGCSGCLVVSTSVGGVPEVLPPHMTYLAETTTESIMEQLEVAMERVIEEKRRMKESEKYRRRKYDEKIANYNRIKDIYNW